MKHGVFAVRDRLAAVFGNPFMQPNEVSAIRAFRDTINAVGETNMLHKHPDDFDLYQLGTWDDSTGLYEVGVPRSIAVGKEMVISSAVSA